MRRLLSLLLLAPLAFAAQDVLLVLQKRASSLAFYTPEGKLLGSVPVGKNPHEMVVSPDGQFAYVTDNGTLRIEEAGAGGNTVSVVDLRQRKRVKTIDLGTHRRPHGIAWDPQGSRLAVTTEMPDALLLVSTNRDEVVKPYPTNGKTSHMVSFDKDGRVAYVSNSGSANVSAIDRVTGQVQLIPAGARPEGSVLSPNGRELFVVNRESNTISVIDTYNRAVVGQIATGKNPVRVGITPDGKTLVYALMQDEKVEFADTQTRQVVGQAAVQGQPVSVSVSPDGQQAFVGVEEADTVFVVSVPERKVVRQFKTRAGAGPDPVVMVRLP